MKILALESSAVSASVALTEDEKLVAQSFQNCGLTHSRTLLPMVENLLANCGVSLSDVDAIAVAHGPGSFTGVRIGVATVKGLALGADKPCLGVLHARGNGMGRPRTRRRPVLRDGCACGSGLQRTFHRRGRQRTPSVR